MSAASGAPPEIGRRSLPPSRALHLRVHEPVGDPVAHAERGRDGASLGRVRRHLAPDAERPVDERPPRPAELREGGVDRPVDLLEDPGHAREQRRPDGRARRRRPRRGRARTRSWHRSGARRGASGGRSCGRAGGRGAVSRPGRRAANASISTDGGRHRVVVAVADQAALGGAGRPGRVDDRVEVVVADGLGRAGRRRPGAWPGALRPPPRARRGRRRGGRRAGAADDRGSRRPCAACASSSQIDEDAARVTRRRAERPRGARRVHRRAHRSDLGEREVDEGPLERRPARGSRRRPPCRSPARAARGRVARPGGRPPPT